MASSQSLSCNARRMKSLCVGGRRLEARATCLCDGDRRMQSDDN
jgi:hypothetical protein